MRTRRGAAAEPGRATVSGEMSPDELRLRLADLLRDDFDLDVQVQGKRLVVVDGNATTIILVTAAKRDASVAGPL